MKWSLRNYFLGPGQVCTRNNWLCLANAGPQEGVKRADWFANHYLIQFSSKAHRLINIKEHWPLFICKCLVTEAFKCQFAHNLRLCVFLISYLLTQDLFRIAANHKN